MPTQNYVPVDELDIGLDRSAITWSGDIQLPSGETHNKVHEALERYDTFTESDTAHSHDQGTLDSLKQKKRHLAGKIRKSLHISKVSDNVDPDARTVLAQDIYDKSDSRLIQDVPESENPSLMQFVHAPIETVKSKLSDHGSHQIAANFAAKEVPHGQEVDLVKAYTAVERADTEKQRLLAIKDVTMLMRERQRTYVRWTLDRHVTKLRALPQGSVKKPSRSDFERHDSEQGLVIDWRGYAQQLLIYYAQQYGGHYIGFGSNPPPPSKETIMANAERVLIASSPFQEFIMTTRRVYRWEKPAETIKYLLIYLVLWYFNLLVPGVISALIYLVIERRVHGVTLDDLRNDIIHTEDRRKTAMSLSEFIEKEGDDKWADELLQGLGPWLMVQLSDLANFFESVRNFYEWRVPHRTLRTLLVLGLIVPTTALVPTWLLVKSMTLGAGVNFFGLFPIATNFPDYRLLVSLPKRLLWNIPTHAEWAIQYVQAEGSRVECNITSSPAVPPKSSPVTKSEPQDLGTYAAIEDKTTGRLIISTNSVRFVSKVGDTTHWTIPYNSITNLEKQDRIISKNIPKKLQANFDSGKDLKFVFIKGGNKDASQGDEGMETEERVVTNVEERDEVFSQVVGFSTTNWQVVW